jgi:hypothetical protein
VKILDGEEAQAGWSRSRGHPSQILAVAVGQAAEVVDFRQQKHVSIGGYNDSGIIAMSMADHRAVIDVVGSRPRFFNIGKTQPDLHLIKQVEQVTMFWPAIALICPASRRIVISVARSERRRIRWLSAAGSSGFIWRAHRGPAVADLWDANLFER